MMISLKFLKYFMFVLVLFFFIVFCGGNVDIVGDEVVIDQIEYIYDDGYMYDGDYMEVDVDKQGLEYIFVYICLMYCDGSGSDELGECFVCGMDYVKNEDMLVDGYNYDYNYDGYNY